MNLVFFSLCILVIELSFGDWSAAKISGPFCDVDLSTPAESIYGVPKTIRYIRDSQCLRGKYDPKALDIVTVGNSTTDQRYLTEGDTWQDNMARYFRKNGSDLNIANAGLDGHSTIGHLWDFEHWFPQLASQPKVYLFYIGLADLYRIEPNGYFDDQVRSVDRLMSKIRARSALYRFYKLLFKNPKANNDPASHHLVKFDAEPYTDKGLVSDYSFQSKYLHEVLLPRLEALAAAAKALGSQPVFLTQRSYHWRIVGGKVMGAEYRFMLGGRVEVNGVDRYVMENATADAILDFCKARNLTCVDARPAIGVSEDFYEWSHNSPVGSEKLGAYIAERIFKVIRQ